MSEDERSVDRAARLSRRPEQPDDEAFLRQLFSETRGGILAGLEPALVEMLLRQQYAGQAMTYRARFPDARFDIVEHDGVPIGRMVVDHKDDAIRLVDIALRAAWRGRGIGTRLLRDLIKGAAAASQPVDLCVIADNVAARRLYERVGFVTVATAETEIDMRWTATVGQSLRGSPG